MTQRKRLNDRYKLPIFEKERKGLRLLVRFRSHQAGLPGLSAGQTRRELHATLEKVQSELGDPEEVDRARLCRRGVEVHPGAVDPAEAAGWDGALSYDTPSQCSLDTWLTPI